MYLYFLLVFIALIDDLKVLLFITNIIRENIYWEGIVKNSSIRNKGLHDALQTDNSMVQVLTPLLISGLV